MLLLRIQPISPSANTTSVQLLCSREMRTVTPCEGWRIIFDALSGDACTGVVSLQTTTGFATVNFDLWPSFSKGILMVLMLIGACAGSTGGGFKVSRLYILMRGAFNELGNLAHPHRVKKVTMDKRPVDSAVLHTANVYLVWYMLVIAVSVILISFEGKDLVTNFTAVVTTVNNVGPGLGLVGPTGNFACFWHRWVYKLTCAVACCNNKSKYQHQYYKYC